MRTGPASQCSDTECFRVLAEPLFQAAGRLPSDARDRVGHQGGMALAGVGVQLDECGCLPFALPCAEEPCLELLIAEVQVSNGLLQNTGKEFGNLIEGERSRTRQEMEPTRMPVERLGQRRRDDRGDVPRIDVAGGCGTE